MDHRGCSHVTAFACRRNFVPLNFSSKFMIRWLPFFEFALLVHFEQSDGKKDKFVKFMIIGSYFHLNCTKCTKNAYSMNWSHLIIYFEEKFNGPKLRRHTYAVTCLPFLWTKNNTPVYLIDLFLHRPGSLNQLWFGDVRLNMKSKSVVSS